MEHKIQAHQEYSKVQDVDDFDTSGTFLQIQSKYDPQSMMLVGFAEQDLDKVNDELAIENDIK